MIQIIDYGRGNLNNVVKSFMNFGYQAEIIDQPKSIKDLSGLVLPGVGAFGDSMDSLNEKGFTSYIRDYIASKKPFLGICLGLQLIFEESDEFGDQKGMGVLKGRVTRFDIDEKVPHIGWNQAEFKKESRLFKGIPNESYFYFVHSYYVTPEDPSVTTTTSHYGIDFTSAIEHENIYATQFHPEKSQKIGLEVIKNFGELCAHHTSR
ncbi:MAG TPA: imidazole glycerol phosphate synthase subunit HisH [Spirochaetes bacterium]|nr:imidazole glycerol phosphate synthase subunit HisH [Spirochaetota bacterium]